MSKLRDFFPPVTPTSQPFMQVQDQKPTGTGGGASVAGDNHRDLNTVMYNDIVGASLASNLVTLPAGTYYIEGNCPAYSTKALVNRAFVAAADDTLLVLGGNCFFFDNNGTVATVNGSFNLLNSTEIKVMHYFKIAATTDQGLGATLTQPPYEIFTDLRIWQVRAGV